MITVRIRLSGGDVVETRCGLDSRLFSDLRRSLGTGEVIDLETNLNGRATGISIVAAQIVSVETSPPVSLRHAPPGPRISPAPYIRIPDFLSAAENAAVMDYAVRREARFTASSIDGSEPDYRRSRVLMQFEGIGIDFESRIREIAQEAAHHLATPCPADYGFEMQMTAHGDAGYFRTHSDNGTPGTATRFLTYVYYFCRDPQPFSGGQLRLYDDAQFDAGTTLPVATFAEIAPANNTLLLFPSRCYHEVMPTYLRVDDFGNRRFTVNGWLRHVDGGRQPSLEH